MVYTVEGISLKRTVKVSQDAQMSLEFGYFLFVFYTFSCTNS